MEITTYSCGSCALASISMISDAGSAEHAMELICQQNFPAGRLMPTAKFRRLAPFYVWVAGPEIPGKGHSKAWVKYGTEFAAYIQEHGLGQVATLGPRINEKYHPDTTCQTWIWAPDDEAVWNWHQALKEKQNAK